MVSEFEARERAVRLAVRTGNMPEIDFIHSVQVFEGFEPCFGRADKWCTNTACRWHKECMELAKILCPAPMTQDRDYPALKRQD
jgi:hypothetical protein